MSKKFLTTCSSPQTIAKMVELVRIHNAAPDGALAPPAAHAIQNLEAVLRSHGAPKHRVPVYRTLGEFKKAAAPSPGLSYHDGVKLRVSPEHELQREIRRGICHDG